MSELAGKDERPMRYGPKTVLWALALMAVSISTAGRQWLGFQASNSDITDNLLVWRV